MIPFSNQKLFGWLRTSEGENMSIDKSLRRKNQLERSRNVLTRGERIKVLQDEERWKEGRSPYGLPKVRVIKVAKKGGKKAKEEETAEGAAPAAAAAATPEKKAEKK
jgi:small basic protein (TIGR04137 family)